MDESFVVLTMCDCLVGLSKAVEQQQPPPGTISKVFITVYSIALAYTKDMVQQIKLL